MGNLFVTNAPMVFSGIWAVCKGFLDEKTRKKIKIIGSDYKKTLLQFVDEDKLPDFLGGTDTRFGQDIGPWNDYDLVNGKIVKKAAAIKADEEEKKDDDDDGGKKLE